MVLKDSVQSNWGASSCSGSAKEGRRCWSSQDAQAPDIWEVDHRFADVVRAILNDCRGWQISETPGVAAEEAAAEDPSLPEEELHIEESYSSIGDTMFPNVESPVMIFADREQTRRLRGRLRKQRAVQHSLALSSSELASLVVEEDDD